MLLYYYTRGTHSLLLPDYYVGIYSLYHGPFPSYMYMYYVYINCTIKLYMYDNLKTCVLYLYLWRLEEVPQSNKYSVYTLQTLN